MLVVGPTGGDRHAGGLTVRLTPAFCYYVDAPVEVAGLGTIPVSVAYGAPATLDYVRNYPVTANSARETDFAARVAADVVGTPRVDADAAPVMGAEDFSFMLNARPGAMLFVGNGDSAKLHHPKYDFNDELIPVGASWWARLVETAMPAP